MNKYFNIDDADHESDWKDLTIMRLLSDVADLEDTIDKAIEFIELKMEDNEYIHTDYIHRMINILRGSDKDE